jgi:predicted Zn-dependent protease with MMP-like domain
MKKKNGRRPEWELLLDEAESALQALEHHEALQLCDRAAQAGEDARYWAALLRGDVLLDMGDAAGALTTYEAVADPSVQDPELDLARGIALFELCRFAESEAALASALRGDDELAEAHYTLGLISEIKGSGREAEHFRRARRIDPMRYPAPASLSRNDFEQVVDEALAELPAQVKQVVTDIPVLIADIPHPDDLARADPPLSPLTLGMFVGVPPHERSLMDAPAEPPAILLFKRNLERAFPLRNDLIVELRKTVIHEVGHALGLDEEDLIERGLE